jgi:hypothetical protein
MALPDPQAVGAFQVTVDSYHLGPLVLGSVTANSQQFRRSQRRRSGIVRLAKVRAYGRVPGMSTTSNPYRGFRFPAEIINQAVWLYHCFSLSLREVELILAARDIVVSYESIREWSLRFGRAYAKTSSGAGRNPATNGFSMKCLFASEANCTTSGARLISMGTCSMCWSRAGATRTPPSVSSASC